MATVELIPGSLGSRGAGEETWQAIRAPAQHEAYLINRNTYSAARSPRCADRAGTAEPSAVSKKLTAPGTMSRRSRVKEPDFGAYLAQRAAYGHPKPHPAAYVKINSEPGLPSSKGIFAGGGRCWFEPT